METEELIRHLAGSARPVRPLPSPGWRTLVWLAIALLSVVLVTLAMSPRPDLPVKLTELRFLVEQMAALATAAAAALAAFALTIPGRSRRVALLPLLPLSVWLASLGAGCLETWLSRGTDGLVLRPDWMCFPAIVMTGAVPALVLVVMVFRGALLMPGLTIALAGLAAAAVGNFGLRLFHPQDASLMVLVWQFGTVILLSLIAGGLGSRLRWQPAGVPALQD